MEAPQKIYLTKNLLGELQDDWNALPSEISTNIEYTRTDTFIKKAVKFMEKIDDVDEYTWYNEEEHAAGITEKCIEDFKKYIECYDKE